MTGALTARAQTPELMDADDLPADVYAAVLADLARANTLTRARPLTLDWLARASAGLKSFTLHDIGFGHGDMLRAIARRFGGRARLTGFDLNPKSKAVAEAASAGFGIDFVTGDARSAQTPDFIVSSLVAHHMDDAELVAFIGWMEATARRGWLINDLHRHWLAEAGFRVLALMARWHPIVRHDGALSVRRGFKRHEWGRILAAAGVQGADIAWVLPFRWRVGRLK